MGEQGRGGGGMFRRALFVNSDASDTARLLTRQVLAEWGLSELRDDAEVIVGEFVANVAVVQAQGSLFGLRLIRAGGHVLIEVHDHSPDEPRWPKPGQELDLLAESGRGLFMVRALAVQFGHRFTAGGLKIVWAVLAADEPANTDGPIRELGSSPAASSASR
ncbi:ATP-binding protein [Actinomadura rupiterrae]|uniref:ATP-binding protein n=1 Tax=Actinomadura rupiterrae TaxID=559627 RepID=UPI0020A42608|nr:ATP-binding protein [Actinomadura rupiterrae]MCP2343839.1 anti-sigma regulatory factor (Ser/Thr protein kinase) [Actinomadura rupiterrae]